MEAEKMDENEWDYHGEGNKSLIVSHSQRCVVLRFLKFLPHRNLTAEEVYQHLHNILDFGKHVMKQFLGESNVHHGDVVKLPLEFLKHLCLKVQSERPESRCEKEMDISGYAMCLPNLTRLQTFPFIEHSPIFCIEIKPKCGFIPSSAYTTKEIKKKVCRFCMHQHLKVSKGKWKRISKYCPLDLFSGHKQRMHFALMSILQDSQNNLKIFKNGTLIYGCRDDQEYLSDLNELAHHLKPFFFPANGLVAGPQCMKIILKELVHVLTNTLLSTSADTGRAGNITSVPVSQTRNYCEASCFCTEFLRNGKHNVETTGLPKGCILYKTLQTQMLDMLDIEGLYPLYKRVEKYLEECPEERSTLLLDGPYDETFFGKLKDLSVEDNGTIEYAVTKIQQYRVAMTAKDCSIMVALSPTMPEDRFDSRPVMKTSRSSFLYSVSILDLDLKPYENIPYQYKRDCKIVSHYLKSNQTQDEPTTSLIYRESEDCTLLLHKV
ncbi:PREDICTED: inositol-pentakisphosphate 2-kinase isoform X1 [Nanorana parkeri]|uniref:inositol-pentakisphosphate 2-kinase isoform X1 n=1 Tax=Nanorana parkeri TaxID=125878 RepID=UPI000854D93F|nr:PREDICTED: inositol-pentakisphosphate 2-kinase isoform X1 [Nanorana parkeri]